MGLAFGTALSVTLSSIWLARSFQRKLGSLQNYRVIPTFLKTVAASIVMGAVVYFLNQFFEGFLDGNRFVAGTGGLDQLHPGGDRRLLWMLSAVTH